MLVGTASVDELAGRAPVMDDFDAEPIVLPDAAVLQAAFEMAVTAREPVLPPALHPTTPPTLTVLAWQCPASPWGPFALAQTRVGCRSGVRPRGFVVGCVVNNADAASGLSAGFGFPTMVGTVELTRHYDRTDLSVAAGETLLLELCAIDPDPLGVADVQYTVTMTLARTPRGPRLVQVEPEYAINRVERLRPSLLRFDPSGWGQPLLAPSTPIAATIALATITIPSLRYACRPDVLAFEGTESVR